MYVQTELGSSILRYLGRPTLLHQDSDGATAGGTGMGGRPEAISVRSVASAARLPGLFVLQHLCHSDARVNGEGSSVVGSDRGTHTAGFDG